LLNCRQSPGSPTPLPYNSTGDDAPVSEDDSSLTTQRRLILRQNLIPESKYPHNSLSSRCCSLLLPVNVLRHPDASFSQSKSLGQLQNRHGPNLRLRFRFLSFFKGALLQNFNRVVERDLMIVVLQQLEDTFSILRTNLCPCLKVPGVGTNAVTADEGSRKMAVFYLFPEHKDCCKTCRHRVNRTYRNLSK
jgi:hypothetical protein